MTREKAKELLPVIQAYAEGKEIECRCLDGTWRDNENMDFNESRTYRIKPETDSSPFTDIDELLETWAKKIGSPARDNTMPVIWGKYKGYAKDVSFQVSGYDTCDGSIRVCDLWYNLNEAFEDFVFLDGSPFGATE